MLNVLNFVFMKLGVIRVKWYWWMIVVRMIICFKYEMLCLMYFLVLVEKGMKYGFIFLCFVGFIYCLGLKIFGLG